MTATEPARRNPFAERFGDLDLGAMGEVDDELRATVPAGSFIERLGITLTHAGPGAARALMPVEAAHLNQAGVAQAGAIAALADATAGWAAKTALRGDATFTTLEVNMNLLKAARPGTTLEAVAAPVHVGRSTMVISVEVRHFDGATNKAGALCAAFRCTEMVIG